MHNDPVNCVDLWGLTASDSGSINFPIRSGDTLSQITKDHNYRYGTDYTAEEIAAMNGIANPDLIYAGNSLKLPVPTTSTYAASGNRIEDDEKQSKETPVEIGSNDNHILKGALEIASGLAVIALGSYEVYQLMRTDPESTSQVGYGAVLSGATLIADGFKRITGNSTTTVKEDLLDLLLSPEASALQSYNGSKRMPGRDIEY